MIPPAASPVAAQRPYCPGTAAAGCSDRSCLLACRRGAGDGVNGADAAQGTAAARRASALVVTVLCLLVFRQIATAFSGPTPVPLVEALFVAAVVVLPLAYVVPATRHWWERYRWWLLGAQAVLTYVPFAVFGNGWVEGMSGLLAGLALLTAAAPVSWLLFGVLAVAEQLLWAAVGPYPFASLVASPAAYLLIAQVDVAFIFFGLARLAGMVAQVHAARGELADLAVTRERLRAAESLRSAVGERLGSVAALAGAAAQAMARSRARAREQIIQAGVIARQAAAAVRSAARHHQDPGLPGEPAGSATRAAVAPRLARTVLAFVLCGFAAEGVNLILAQPVGPVVTALAVADAVAFTVLQLRHSWPSPGSGRPWAWPWTLALQAALTYAALAFPGSVHSLLLAVFAGFLAGSALLLLPGRWAWAAYAAAAVSPVVAYAANPGPLDTLRAEISYVAYVGSGPAEIGLLVFGLSWLAGLAVQLDWLRGEVAIAAAAAERERVARDTHDLLGLGLSAAALKTDLIGRLIGRDEAAARAEIAELRRICAAASADIRLVTGQGERLSLDGELAAARELLVSAGIEVRADITGGPRPAAADAVLAPVLREAITNILRHSSATRCTVVMTVGDGGCGLSVGNDGAADPAAGDRGTGHGLANLTARVEAAGGCLTSYQAGGRFELIAQIPLPADHEREGEPAAGGSAPGLPAG